MTVNFGTMLFNLKNQSSVASAKQSAEVGQNYEIEQSAPVNSNPEEESLISKLKAENSGESIYKIANDIANGDYSVAKVKCSKSYAAEATSAKEVNNNNKFYINLPQAAMRTLKELILSLRNTRPGGTTPTGGGEGTGETGGTTPTGGGEETGETGGTTPTGGGEGSSGLENFIGDGFNIIWYTIAKTTYGPDAAGMLDLAHENRNDPTYERDAIKMSNWNDNSVSVDKDFLKNKVATEFYDYGFDVDTIPGYFFQSYSDPCKRIAEDPDFLATISNKTKVLDNNQDLGMGFTESNLHYALGHVAIRNRYLDSDGNLHVFIYDTYDFNSSDTSTLSVAGRNAMMNGELKPYFTIHEVVVPKSKLDTLWG